MSDLTKKTCEPCKGGIPPLTNAEIQPLYAELDQGWEVVDDHHLEKTYSYSSKKLLLNLMVGSF